MRCLFLVFNPLVRWEVTIYHLKMYSYLTLHERAKHYKEKLIEVVPITLENSQITIYCGDMQRLKMISSLKRCPLGEFLSCENYNI